MASELQVNTITEATSGSGITFAKDIIPATPLSHRNMIINGAMQVAQRGTSFSITQTNNGGFALDRFKYYQGSTVGQWEGTMSQHTMTSAELNTTGHAKALKIATGTVENAWGADESANVHQIIEAQNLQHLQYGTAAAKSVTLSFWVKSSVTGTFAVGLYKDDSAGSLNDRIINKTISISDTNWNKYTLTFPGDTDSSATITNDNGAGIHILWHLGAGSDFNDGANTSWETYTSAGWAGGHAQNGIMTTSGATWYLTGVQLELGSVATPFEHRSYTDELLKCWRYYYKIVEGHLKWVGSGGYYSSSIFVCYKQWPVEMRATPTIDYVTGTNYYAILGDGTDLCDSLSITRPHPLGGGFDVGGNVSGTSGDGGVLSTNNAAAYVAVTAEL